MHESKQGQTAPAADEQIGRKRPAEPCYTPPPPPPMRTVTKGWWVLREGQTTVEELAQARLGRTH